MRNHYLSRATEACYVPPPLPTTPFRHLYPRLWRFWTTNVHLIIPAALCGAIGFAVGAAVAMLVTL